MCYNIGMKKHERIKVYADQYRTIRIRESDYEIMRNECERRQIPLIDLQHELCESLDKKTEKR